ncbi:TetR/AcrR family transcriptional regulator (plasmid) [Rhodococcus sp. ZPP]|uniref:TetR/AcrR family transcriptional regulator n=1 Tax=Rhodococcus sp. ZPP TaxID=2749906 RepID=UPI001AD86911|nr:TetR/AcrR family transcriptional regulator [Rhodococcus sp. ZPP]QTJ70711.1 TetR/AcrR family transcriptional regulator [Rhodococcus sp. ZPP]
MPGTERAAGRDQQILDAAERLFFERSFDGVSVDEIGREAGVTGSAIYTHFRAKDEILASLFTRAVEALLRRLGDPDPDPAVELEKLLKAFVDLTTRHERLAGIWVREQRSLAEAYRRDHDRRQRYITQRWVDCLTRLYPRASGDEIVTATRGLQLLLLSEALRPPTGRRARDAEELLLRMARASLGALGAREMPLPLLID